ARDPARDPARNEETAHLSCALPDRDHIPDVLARLVQSGVRVYRLTPQEPALEDVYFALHGGGELTA
ncbi:MAG: hypothetical protein JXB35_06625, partial [Anaerolineae bacterium]|nr:hypothetical protein [Anaerolineae bacterium]